jgi:hypothetical protein
MIILNLHMFGSVIFAAIIMFTSLLLLLLVGRSDLQCRV